MIRPRRSILSTAGLLATLLMGISASAGAASDDLSWRSSAARRGGPGPTLRGRSLTAGSGGVPIANFLLAGSISPPLLRSFGVEVNTWTPAGVTARVPLSRLPLLQSLPGVRAAFPANRCRYYLDQSAVDADVASVRIAAPPAFSGQTGAGVLVGLVDSGVDLYHGDFRGRDGLTRIVSLWDQNVEGQHPNGFTYGVEWTPAQINAGDAEETDDVGHGTHVLGIAAGDGSSASHGQPQYVYVGMAPEADLCVVKTDLTVSGIVDGINYIFQVAAARGQPAVVNLSIGTQEGPHDGTLLMDQMINALTGPGRIVVAAAGNEGADHLHAQVTLTPTTGQQMTLLVPPYTPGTGNEDDYFIVSGWYEPTDQIAVTLTTPSGVVLGPVAPGDSLTGRFTPDGYIDLWNATAPTTNGDRQIYLQVFDPLGASPPARGAWRFQYTPLSIGGPGRVDAYIETSQLGDGLSLAEWTQGLVFGGVVGAPGDADSVIAVGAHVTKVCWDAFDGFFRCFNPAPPVGAIANFSSQGPRRDGALKPDLTAPGFGVVSARSRTAAFSNSEVTPDGTHAILAGTSMSTPHVTGAVALLLGHRANALATPAQIRSQLQAWARADGHTGGVPNVSWGSGKLDVAASLGPALAVSVPRPIAGHAAVFADTDSVEVHVDGGTADSVVVMLSKNSGISYTQRLGAFPAMGPNETRILTYRVDPSWQTYHARVRCIAYNASMGDVRAYSSGFFLIQPELTTALRVTAPNPAKGVATIYFELLQPGHAEVRIFSSRGSLVRTLADQVYPAGRHSLDWDGKDERGASTASGIYYCDFRGGGVHDSRKIVRIK
jgi:subtilisin family serine protease